MHEINAGTWSADCAWSIPLIAMNVVFHVAGLGLVTEQVDRVLGRLKSHERFASIFAVVMSITATFATMLHGVETGAWALAYQLLGALPDTRSAMLYSLGAMTTYGNSGMSLPDEWRLMGSLEALNGALLFGLTTAFLFAMIQRVRPIGGLGGARRLCAASIRIVHMDLVQQLIKTVAISVNHWPVSLNSCRRHNRA